MKKLFLAVTAAAFTIAFIACSTDQTLTSVDSNETLLNQNSDHASFKVSKITLDSLYKIMIVSASYVDYTAAESAFIDKMHFDGSSSDLQNQTTIMSWISTNLAKTSFTSYSAAVTEMSNVRNKLSTLLTDQSRFFDASLDADENDYADVVVGNDPVIEPDGCGCGTAYMACKKGAAKEFDQLEKIISDNPNAGLAEHIGARWNYYMAKTACVRAYVLCHLGCD